MPREQIFDLRTYLDYDVLAAYTDFLPRAQKWRCNPTKEAGRLGVDSTSVRAISTGIRGAKDGPVAVYEEWANQQIEQVTKDLVLQQSLATREGFEAWHASLVDSLVAHWRERVRLNNLKLRADEGDEHIPANQDLNIAHRYKMVDLFVKYMWVQGFKDPELVNHCYAFGHMPLDLKSLAVLSAAFSGILVGAGEKFSMGDIVSEQMYRSCQDLARAICQEAGGTPIMLDIFAWHASFAQQLYAKRPTLQSRKAMTREKNRAKAAARVQRN